MELWDIRVAWYSYLLVQFRIVIGRNITLALCAMPRLKRTCGNSPRSHLNRPPHSDRRSASILTSNITICLASRLLSSSHAVSLGKWFVVWLFYPVRNACRLLSPFPPASAASRVRQLQEPQHHYQAHLRRAKYLRILAILEGTRSQCRKAGR